MLIIPFLVMNMFAFSLLARLRWPSAAFLLNGAITRGASGLTFFRQSYPSYIQSFIKIGGAVLEKNEHKIMTLRNFNKDINNYAVFCIFLFENMVDEIISKAGL